MTVFIPACRYGRFFIWGALRLTTMNKLTLKSPAKINLFLKVLARRPDGYHNIETLFERINLCDKIILQNIPRNIIEIRSKHPLLPKGRTNLAYIAASLLKKDFLINKGVRITIEKRIPIGSGLGGGSSDAATVLLGLNRLWGLKLDRKGLLKYARRIGADVAFFIFNRPFAIGKKRGDEIRILDLKRRLWHVLVVPDLNVSTAGAYKEFDRRGQDLRLTRPGFNSRIFKSLGQKKRFFAGPFIHNDLEAVISRRHRPVYLALAALRKLCGIAAMSGSGSAVFAIAPNKNAAYKIKSKLSGLKGVKAFVVRTY